MVYNESFVKGDKRFEDMYGHGTHVAGILGGDGEKSTGSAYTRTFRGIAPGVHQINLRVLDANGVGTDSAIIAAIERAIQLKLLYNIRVINLSVGRPVYESHTTDPLCQAVEQAWKAGIVVVVAAGNEGRNNTFGNEGYGTIMSPANDPYVITVGSMKDMSTTSRGDDQIASYSSKGPTSIDHVVKPDIVAPGNRIISLAASGNIAQASSLALNLVPQSYYQRNGSSTAASSDYYMLSGTSMAAPMVSGAAALLIQKRPNLTPDQVKAILMKTATKTFPAMSVTYDSATNQTFTSRYDIFTIGAGYLDVWAALNSSDTPKGSRNLRSLFLIPRPEPWSLRKVHPPLGDPLLTIRSLPFGERRCSSMAARLLGAALPYGETPQPGVPIQTAPFPQCGATRQPGAVQRPGVVRPPGD